MSERMWIAKTIADLADALDRKTESSDADLLRSRVWLRALADRHRELADYVEVLQQQTVPQTQRLPAVLPENVVLIDCLAIRREARA